MPCNKEQRQKYFFKYRILVTQFGYLSQCHDNLVLTLLRSKESTVKALRFDGSYCNKLFCEIQQDRNINPGSAPDANITLVENVQSALDNNKFVCGIFIDLEKTFDKVDHNI